METPSQSPANRDPHLWEQAENRVGFKQHLRSYLLVNAIVWIIFLVLVYGFGNARFGAFPWPLFMTLGWGIGLLAHYIGVYWLASRPDNQVEKEYRRLQQRR